MEAGDRFKASVSSIERSAQKTKWKKSVGGRGKQSLFPHLFPQLFLKRKDLWCLRHPRAGQQTSITPMISLTLSGLSWHLVLMWQMSFLALLAGLCDQQCWEVPRPYWICLVYITLQQQWFRPQCLPVNPIFLMVFWDRKVRIYFWMTFKFPIGFFFLMEIIF